jgi:hypothetical protein
VLISPQFHLFHAFAGNQSVKKWSPLFSQYQPKRHIRRCDAFLNFFGKGAKIFELCVLFQNSFSCSQTASFLNAHNRVTPRIDFAPRSSTKSGV